MLNIRVNKEIVAQYIEPYIDMIQKRLLSLYDENTEQETFSMEIRLAGELSAFKVICEGRWFYVNTAHNVPRLVTVLLFHDRLFMAMDYCHGVDFILNDRKQLLNFISSNISYQIRLFIYDVNQMNNLGYGIDIESPTKSNEGVRFERRLNNEVDSFVYTYREINRAGVKVSRIAGFIFPEWANSFQHGYGMTSHFNAVKSFLTGDWGMNSYFDKIEMMDIVPRDMRDVLIKEE